VSAGDSSKHSCHNKQQSPSIAAGARRIAGCPTRTHGVAYGRSTCAALWPCSAHHSVLEPVRRLATVPPTLVTLLQAYVRTGTGSQRGRRRIDYSSPPIPAAEGSAWGALLGHTSHQPLCESP
jgi:hypothetical protein